MITRDSLENPIDRTARKIDPGHKTFDFVDKVIIDFDESRRKFKIGTVRKWCSGKATLLDDKAADGFTRLCLTQPRWELWEYLEEKLEDDAYRISHFEPSRDYLFRDPEDADTLREYIRESVEIRLEDEVYSSPIEVERTIYFNDDSAAFNFVAYADKPSKLHRGPCCHTEFRIRESAVDRIMVGLIYEIIDFDFDAVWTKHLHRRARRLPRARVRVRA